MTRKRNRSPSPEPIPKPDATPPGATQAAFDRDRDEKHGGPPHTRLVDPHVTGEDENDLPTGLVGGENDVRDVEGEDLLENGPPYAGHSGGAVGGTPAERRSRGGKVKGGIAPSSGTRNVDSTIGHNPWR